ncbi:MAG: mobile mystery protein B [Bdellovibrionales bacterium]|nr:mobile mystery protein B [Bdellovibrionales bacterium]
MKFSYPKGATPLDQNEINGLIPSGMTRQSELNELEEANILKAQQWSLTRKSNKYLSVDYLKKLHSKMFDEVWTWAGTFRKTNKNIGVDKSIIQIELKKLLDDTSYWIPQKTYDWIELGARFHHRLVSIHPFPNGNGRHSRLMTDILLLQNNQKRFSWGMGSLVDEGTLRHTYISALKKADNNDYTPLIDFVSRK